MTDHVCREAQSCRCSIVADEPNEKCPQHGWPQPACRTCGRFMPYPAPDRSYEPQEDLGRPTEPPHDPFDDVVSRTHSG